LVAYCVVCGVRCEKGKVCFRRFVCVCVCVFVVCVCVCE
jgi:hypothetical protein